jgi:hypothetical protein
METGQTAKSEREREREKKDIEIKFRGAKSVRSEEVNKICRFVRTSQETHYVSATSPAG